MGAQRPYFAPSSAEMLHLCYFLGENIEHWRVFSYNRRQWCIGLGGERPTAGSGGLAHGVLVDLSEREVRNGKPRGDTDDGAGTTQKI
jgi:hypothetical protein